MLRVQLGGDNIEVKFDYRLCTPIEIEGKTGVCVDEDRRCSLAKVYLNDELFNIGMAICNPNDNFCKTIGRKKALADGIYALSKKLRTAVWEEYKAVCNL